MKLRGQILTNLCLLNIFVATGIDTCILYLSYFQEVKIKKRRS